MSDRRDLAREICRRVAARVWRATPAGCGHWRPAWTLVEEPSDRFLDALAAWVEEATDETEANVRRTADELVQAWRHVGWLYEAAAEAERETLETTSTTGGDHAA